MMEQYSLAVGMTIHLVLDMEEPSEVPKCVDRIHKVTAALHLKCDQENVMTCNDVVECRQIPDDLNTLDESLQWALLNAPVQSTWPLATLCAKSHIIVLSVTHAFHDGVGLKNILAERLDPTITESLTFLPKPFWNLITNEIEEAPPHPLPMNNPMFTQVKLPQPLKPDKSDVLQMVPLKYSIDELGCYEDGKVHGLTEWLCASLILAATAISDLHDGFGLPIAVDVRRFLTGKELSFNTPAISADMGISAVNPQSVADLMCGLRRDLNSAIDSSRWLGTIHWMMTDGSDPNEARGSLMYLSNIGQWAVKKPMLKVHQTEPSDGIAMSAYSVVSESRNIVKVQMTYSAAFLKREDMRIFTNIIDFAIRNMKREWSIDLAINELRKQCPRHETLAPMLTMMDEVLMEIVSGLND